MGLNGMFSDYLCIYIQRPTYISGFNQVGAHEFVLDVLRLSLYIYTETYI